MSTVAEYERRAPTHEVVLIRGEIIRDSEDRR
jgi:hypothetical protein